ncbi:MAG: discoidin domain-containing protein, partial [Tepidisphaeraceae bacterium]
VDGSPTKLHLNADKTTIDGTDATDDCQIIVTVLDAAGRHVSASPPVRLTIESGPGEFPTGRSITFSDDSYIKIEQGQAAMALRSYHGGATLIRASSPGLTDATIEITTIGQPAFEPDVTPIVSPRPYTPPPMSAGAIEAMKNVVNVALNRPSRASSEAEHNPARLGNDADTQSSWSAADNAADAWWLVDLEGFYQLSSSRVTFPEPGNWRFVIDLSQDGAIWTRAVDQSATENTAAVRNDIFPPGAVARYLRVTWTSVPSGQCAAVAEVEVFGVLWVR